MFQLLRPSQWIKNLLLFVPIFFAGKVQDASLWLPLVLAFFSFSLMASAVYVLNDYCDIERDRLHPKKRFRPLASGVVTLPQARVLFVFLVVISLIISYLVSLSLSGLVAAYLLLNIAYSLRLKHEAIIDITILACGFLLRIFAGSLPFEIVVSKWLIIMIFLFSMFIGIAKRRGELILSNNNVTRKSLDGYNLQFIDVTMVMMAAVTIVCYIMYTVSEEVVLRLGSDYVYLTTAFVLLGILRYLQQTIVFEKTEAPTEFFFTDRFVQIAVLGWAIAFGVLLYA
jgi:decaprenyl-phosphate phosphoribosyltransferase